MVGVGRDAVRDVRGRRGDHAPPAQRTDLSLLDLPDEETRPWRGLPAALIGAGLLLVAGVVVARTFALGGWERPWLAVQSVVALPAMVVAWALAGPHRFRTALTGGVMVLALALQPLATSGATPSTARLQQIIDDIGLPGETIGEVRVGNGRCRPSCTELRRTSVVKGMSYAKVRGQIDGLMRAHGFELKVYGHHPGQPERIDASSDRFLVQLELRDIGLAETRVAQVWIARGPAPEGRVG